jgi:hypothetical protein
MKCMGLLTLASAAAAGLLSARSARVVASPARALAPSSAAASWSSPVFSVIALRSEVRDSIRAIFARSNDHWNELADENTLTQMLGTGKPTQREYLGCLRGYVASDTLWITGTEPARGMRRLQFAVTGSCVAVADLVGTWHTHPFRADSTGHALKERTLSRDDLNTFAAGRDLVILAVWDVDSLDAAARTLEGGVRHPVSWVGR